MSFSFRNVRPQEVLRPFQEFFRQEAAGGLLLIASTVLAMIWANSPLADSYHELWRTEIRAGFGSWNIAKPLHDWINDGLMAVFFFSVGLEIKREILVGELASVRRALLPVSGAVGGMLVPALIYLAFNAGRPTANGWGIPMATDIAFALGILSLLGNRVCLSLKIFLTALAIVDDIGAVLVIALFYTSTISLAAFGAAGLFLAGLMVANRAGVDSPLAYSVLGVGLWASFLQSGVHAAVAGVVIAMTIPARPRLSDVEFLERSSRTLEDFRAAGTHGLRILGNEKRRRFAASLVRTGRSVQTPLQRMEHELNPWVMFLIMPVFALANAGVHLGPGIGGALSDRVSLGIIAGLVIGKQTGIVLFSWLAVKARLADLPGDVGWMDIYAAGWLGGVGFTMSLFIANLAFGVSPEVIRAKEGILAGSLLAGVVGWLLFRLTASCRASSLAR